MQTDDECWLSEVFKYRESKIEPLENFLSTIFAWVMAKHGPIRREILRLIFDGLNGMEDRVFEKLSIATQRTNAKGQRPDIWLESPEAVIYIECKVNAPFDEKQLDRYRQELSERMERIKLLVYVGRFKPTVLPHCVGSTTWRKIYSILKAKQDNCVLVEGLLTFMERQGMKDMPITDAVVDVISKHRNSFQAVKDIVDEAVQKVRDKHKKDPEKLANLSLAWKEHENELGSPEDKPQHCYYGRYLPRDEKDINIWVGLAWGKQPSQVYVAVQIKSDNKMTKLLDDPSPLWQLNWNGSSSKWKGRTFAIEVLEKGFAKMEAGQQVEWLGDQIYDMLEQLNGIISVK
jgi:hypothetical protein